MPDDPVYSSGFDDLIGHRVVSASGDEVRSTITITPELLQPGLIVHGGVYATVVETTASIGATLWLDGDGVAVGITNSTDFLRRTEAGVLSVVATPLQRGKTLQLWQVSVTDDEGRLVAHGRVKLANIRP